MCQRDFIIKYMVIMILMMGYVMGATFPQLYTTTNYQSPVEAESNRIVTLSGYDIDKNATVYYIESDIKDSLPKYPDFLPDEADDSRGFLKIISNNDTPYTLSVKFPESASRDKLYSVWVKNPQGGWSKRVLINDPRPQWIFPKRGYRSEDFGSFGRRYFIAGRNLKIAVDRNLMITLKDEAKGISYEVLPKVYKENSADYLLTFELPQEMEEGNYSVSLFGRDVENNLIILQDPEPKRRFDVRDYGGVPSDGEDDTHAIRDAIADAVAHGGGEIYLSEGVWEFKKSPESVDVYGREVQQGEILPPNLDLIGEGIDKTIIKKYDSWYINDGAMFTLQGNNIVRGIKFIQEVEDEDKRGRFSAFCIGKKPWIQKSSDPSVAENIRIEESAFIGMFIAIGSYGLPLRELYVTNNLFHPYKKAIGLGGNAFLTPPKYMRFFFEDSVVFNNTFLPGDYLGVYNDKGEPTQGPIVIEPSGTIRFSFLDNIANGRGDYGGFRGGVFWYSLNSSKHVLVANNSIYCSGDKAANSGEAIVTDSNYLDTAFNGLSDILDVSPTTITPAKVWDYNLTDYYKRYWVYVVEGPGMGQTREIIHNQAEPNTPIDIYPAWDVIPEVGKSKIIITTSYNWFYIINNIIDNRTECKKTNPSGNTGFVSIYSISSDSVIANNELIDTGGITIVGTSGNDGHLGTSYFLTVENNYIIGRYSENTTRGGIIISYGIMDQKEESLHNYNVDIFNNTIDDSFSYARNHNVAIGYYSTYWSPVNEKAFKNLIISQNKILNVPIGIGLLQVPFDYVFFNNMICDNIFENISEIEIEEFGIDTVICK